jgi:hypothetical protein
MVVIIWYLDLQWYNWNIVESGVKHHPNPHVYGGNSTLLDPLYFEHLSCFTILSFKYAFQIIMWILQINIVLYSVPKIIVLKIQKDSSTKT